MDRHAISADDIASFREHGILKVNYEHLVGTDAFRGLTEALCDAEEKARMRPPTIEEGNIQPEMFNRLTYLRDKYQEVDAVARSPRIGEIAARLAGVRHVRSWIDETFFKPPRSRPVPWHQDLPHFPMDRKGFLTFWVAINDVTEEMGPVEYLTRSNHLGPLGRALADDSRHRAEPLRQTPFEYLYEGEQDKVGPIKSFTLRPGEAVIHDGLTIHGSGTNQSDRVRRGWACAYFPADAQYTGMPREESDGIGLIPFRNFDHPKFPVVA